jgi:hypothetical protein
LGPIILFKKNFALFLSNMVELFTCRRYKYHSCTPEKLFEKIHNSFVTGSLERFELEHGTEDDEGISARSEFVQELKKQLLISVNEIFEELKEKHRLRLEEQATMEAAAKIRIVREQLEEELGY